MEPDDQGRSQGVCTRQHGRAPELVLLDMEGMPDIRYVPRYSLMFLV